jgi:hypothetical protein
MTGGLMLLVAWEPTYAQFSHVRTERTGSAVTKSDDPFHGRYSTYGVEKTNYIRVLVAGNCIKTPGYYFIPKGATFGDAIKTAGVKEWYENHYYAGFFINVGRKGQSKGRYRMLHFDGRQEAEKEILRDGDEIEMTPKERPL